MSLLRLVDDEHGTEVEIGDRMLPYKTGVVTLILDDIDAEVIARVRLAQLSRSARDREAARGTNDNTGLIARTDGYAALRAEE